MKGIAHGRSHARAMAEDQHRSAQQVERTSHGIHGICAPCKDPRESERSMFNVHATIVSSIICNIRRKFACGMRY